MALETGADNPTGMGGGQSPAFDEAAVASQMTNERLLSRGAAAKEEDGREDAGETGESEAEGQVPSETEDEEEAEAEEEIAAVLASDRQQRIKQAVTERKKIQDDLKKLGADVLSVTGGGFNLIQRWMPGLANTITQFMSAGSMRKGQARVDMLQATVTSLKVLSALLFTARGFTALIDALIDLVKAIAYTIETIVIPIILVILSPLILLIMTVVYWGMGSGKLTKSVKQVSKKVDDMLKKYEPELEKEKTKISLVRRRAELDAIIGSFSRT